jgi:hypothetical protein
LLRCIFSNEGLESGEFLNIRLIIYYQQKVNVTIIILIKFKMKIKEFITRFGKVMPYIGLYIGLSNHSLALENKEARIQAARVVHNDLLERLREVQDMTIVDETVRNKIGGLSSWGAERVQDATKDVGILKGIIARLKERLDSGEVIDPKEIDMIQNSLNYHSDQAAINLEKANSILQEILDSIFGSGSSSSNFIDSSGLLNSWNSILENYKSFLSTLEVEMYCPLLNTLGLITISFCLASIAAIIYGDLLIKHLNLEVKYPRIAKFIQLRRRFQFYYLNIDFLLILVTLISLFYFNIKHFIYLYVV